MVLAAASLPDGTADEMTAALIHTPVPGVDTLSDSDRSVDTQPLDVNESVSLPLVSRNVSATGRSAAASHARGLRPSDRTRAVLRPTRRNPEPVKNATVSCRELDPIARFLASANIGPRCQA